MFKKHKNKNIYFIYKVIYRHYQQERKKQNKTKSEKKKKIKDDLQDGNTEMDEGKVC